MSDEQLKQQEREKEHREAMANLMAQGLIKYDEAGMYFEKDTGETDEEFKRKKARVPKYDVTQMRKLLPEVLEVVFDFDNKTATIHDGKSDAMMISFKKFPKDTQALADVIRDHYNRAIDREAMANAESVFEDI